MLTFKCACGQTEAKLAGAPSNNIACYCHSCVATGQFIDAKGGGTSQLNEHGGFVYSFFSPVQADFTKKPKAGFGCAKVGDKGSNLRCYAKCCNTSVFFIPLSKIILLNTNCIYNEDGSKYEADPKPNHYMKKCAFDPEKVPEPSFSMIRFSDVFGLLKVLFNPCAPKVTDKDLILDPKDADVVPITWE